MAEGSRWGGGGPMDTAGGTRLRVSDMRATSARSRGRTRPPAARSLSSPTATVHRGSSSRGSPRSEAPFVQHASSERLPPASPRLIPSRHIILPGCPQRARPRRSPPTRPTAGPEPLQLQWILGTCLQVLAATATARCVSPGPSAARTRRRSARLPIHGRRPPRARSLACTHYKPPGAAWAQYAVLFVMADEDRGSKRYTARLVRVRRISAGVGRF